MLPAIDAMEAMEALHELEASIKRETVHLAASQLVRVPAPSLVRVEVSWPTRAYRHIRQWRRTRG